MKVAFVSFMRAFPWGGSEELWFRAAKLALASGHTVCTLTQRWDSVPDKVSQLRQLGAETKFYDRARYSLAERVAHNLGVRQRVPDAMPEVQADVFILSNGSTWDFVEHSQLFQQIIGRSRPYALIVQHSFEHGHIVAEGQRSFAMEVMQKAAKLFFVAERNWQAAERQLGCRLARAEVVSNPVNIAHRAIKPFPAGGRLLMACIARLDCSFKGQDLLLEVLGAQSWGGRDFRLRLYGSGPHRPHLQRLIEMYGLAGKVSIEGHVNDVDSIWEANQVLVLPSLSEGTPLSLVEAMLCGRAAVATDVGDIGTYVLNSETGFLAATASVKCLAHSLEDLWANQYRLQAMGEAAFRHAAAITDFKPEVKLLNFVQLTATAAFSER